MSQEDIEALPGAVTGLESAEKYLTSVLLRQADEPLSPLHLAGVLFQVTQMAKPIPLAVTNAIRAVAFILKQHAASEIAEVVAKIAAEQLADSLSANIVNNVIAAIAPQVASIHTTAEALKTTFDHSKQLHDTMEREKEEERNDLKTAAERIEDAVDTLYESIEDCNNSYKLLTPSLEFTQDRLNNLATQLSQPLPTITQPTAPIPALPTYSSVAAANIPPSIDQAVARASIRAKQILLDPTSGHSLFPADTTNAFIAKRLSDILLDIRSEGTPTGTVRAVQRLRNGGLIVELDNENLAGWLKGPTGRILLESHLDSTACIRDRTFSIVIQFLLITYEIERDDFPRHIEAENHLPPNSIASIRWIKPPQRRTREQRTAFALLQVKDVETANNILKEGICIDAHRYAVNKDHKEPLRCAKCQKFGHMARNCSSPHDICGTCSGRHRTAQCNAFRTECCVSCKSQSHTSWSRKCPEFIRRCKTLDEQYPENKLPFFPTSSSWLPSTTPPRPSNTPPSRSVSPRNAKSSSPPPADVTIQPLPNLQTTLPFKRVNPPQTPEPASSSSIISTSPVTPTPITTLTPSTPSTSSPPSAIASTSPSTPSSASLTSPSPSSTSTYATPTASPNSPLLDV